MRMLSPKANLEKKVHQTRDQDVAHAQKRVTVPLTFLYANNDSARKKTLHNYVKFSDLKSVQLAVIWCRLVQLGGTLWRLLQLGADWCILVQFIATW